MQDAQDVFNWGAVIAAALSMAVSVFAVIATSGLAWHRDERKALLEYLSIVKAAAHELRFYLGKLHRVIEDVEKLAALIPERLQPVIFVIPTYDLYPDYLEQIKLELAKRTRNDGLVQQISNCHFELCHIRERFAQTKAAFSEHFLNIAHASNLRTENLAGFLALVRQNIELFEKCIDAFDLEAKATKSAYDEYSQRHPLAF